MYTQFCFLYATVITFMMVTQCDARVFSYKLINELDPNLRQLDWSNNTSIELPKDRPMMALKELKRFYCNNCSIHSIYKQSFVMLPQLKYLELNHNNLSYIHPDAFENNQMLHKVTLIGNNLVKFNPEAALRHVSQISCLIIDQNPSFDINEVTIELPWLTYFSCKHCNTSVIEKSTMSRWKRLVNLHLSYNNINQIKPDAFEDPIRLKYLKVDGNSELKELAFKSKTILHLSAEKCGLEGKLDTSSLEALEFINVRSNSISNVYEHGFSNNKKIKKILLDNNAIKKIPEKLLGLPLYDLDTLCIDGNPLQPWELFYDFAKKYLNKKLRRGCFYDDNITNQFENIIPSLNGKALYKEHDNIKVDYSFTFQSINEDIVYIESTFFMDATFLRNVILDKSKQLSFPLNRAFLQSDSITNLSLAFCAINDVYVETFQQLPNIKCINLRGNKMRSLNTHLIFQNNTLIEELDFSENELTFIVSNLFQDLKNLRVLNLQLNQLYTIVPGNLVLESPSLEFFNCHQCSFHQIDQIMLSGLTNLKHLNVSQNVIVDVHENAFGWTKNLQSVDLSDNKLKKFEPDLQKHNNLNTLCLSGNDELLSSDLVDKMKMQSFLRVEELEIDCREDNFLAKIYVNVEKEENVKRANDVLFKNESSSLTRKSSCSGTMKVSIYFIFGLFLARFVLWAR